MARKLPLDRDRTRARAHDVLEKMGGISPDENLAAARQLVRDLRDLRDYELMGRLAEAVSRVDPADATNRRLYAQYLIETGKVTAAIDVLRPLTRLPKGHPERTEARGLIGRAYKQIFLEAGDKTTVPAREALKHAIAAYRVPFEESGATWHGVNLVALLTRARLLGIRTAPDLPPKRVAQQVVATLTRTPDERRDEWFLPTLAEASLGLDDPTLAERHLRAYVAAPDVSAFHIASTLRQFTQVWGLEQADVRRSALVNILRARLAEVPGGEVQMSPADVQRVRHAAPPPQAQLEAVLGIDGPQTYRWWKTGLDRAAAVGAVRAQLGGRIGTGFLVRAADLGQEPEDELLVLTNFHVVNPHGVNGGISPEEAEIAFEAADGAPVYAVAAVVWSSPPERHDAALLRLSRTVSGIAPLPMASVLPVLDGNPRVYVIGYPGGRDLAFSFQDNDLLDHEGPPAGAPRIPGVCRVHYRAPTEGGSSGSPVFNGRLWQVIALHHKGGRTGMPRLNGKTGTYAANEGISTASIISAMREERAGTPPVV